MRINHSNGERIGLFLLVAFMGTLVWSLHSSAFKSDGLNGLESSNYSTALSSPIESPTPCCNNKPHLLVGTYYSVKNGLGAKLLLNNKGPEPLIASPTLFSMSGQRFDTPPVTIDGRSFQMIDMSGWINAAGLQFEEGSIEVFHLGEDLVLGAQVYLQDQNHSLSFDEKLVETKTFKSTRLDGLWWLPSQKGQVLLALSNNSDSPVTATIDAKGRTPQRDGQEVVALAAHETRLLDVQADVMHHANGAMSRFGGISINYSGSPGALYARAMAQDLSIGYSLAVQFSDPTAGKSTKLQGVGLRLGFAGGEALNQVAIVRNVGNSNTTVTGRVSYTDQSGTTNTVPIAALNLSASETVTVDLGRLLQQSGHYHPEAIGSLELEYSTAIGSVIASTLSVSGSGNQVFRVPMWDIYGLRSSTGGYPWRIDGNSSTMVYVKNSADNPQHYFMNIHFDGGGDYQIGTKTIEAGETVAFDLRKLRDEQVPDIHGQRIPSTVSSGQVHWTKAGMEPGVLIGRSEQVDTGLGISSNYACANCCDDSARNGRIVPNSATVDAGQTYDFVAMDDLQDCYGGSYSQEIFAASWSSSNENVATVSVGQATAQVAGTTTITADFYDTQHVVILCGPFGNPPGFGGDCCDPRQQHFTPTTTLTVKPHIDSISPAASAVGHPVTATISGKGFASGASISAGSGVTISEITVSSDTSMTATFSVDANATAGNRDVTVTVNSQVSNTKPFSVQVPDRLTVVSDTGSQPLTNCPSVRGRMITYQVADSSSSHAAIAQQIWVEESFSNQTTNTCGNGQPNPATCELTSSSGQFTDGITMTDHCASSVLAACASNPSCGYEHTQLWLTCSQDGSIELTSVAGITHCNEIKVNNSTQFSIGTLLPK
jgi:hypothetical protein